MKEYLVEKILASKKKEGKKYYKILWKGFSEKDATWEP